MHLHLGWQTHKLHLSSPNVPLPADLHFSSELHSLALLCMARPELCSPCTAVDFTHELTRAWLSALRADHYTAISINPLGQSTCQGLQPKHTQKCTPLCKGWPSSAAGEGLTPPMEPGSAPSPQGLVYLPNTKLFSWPKTETKTEVCCFSRSCPHFTAHNLLPHKPHLPVSFLFPSSLRLVWCSYWQGVCLTFEPLSASGPKRHPLVQRRSSAPKKPSHIVGTKVVPLFPEDSLPQQCLMGINYILIIRTSITAEEGRSVQCSLSKRKEQVTKETDRGWGEPAL